MARIHSFQHVPFEGMGSFIREFEQRGWPMSTTHWYNGDSAPELDQFDWLVIMGGPMNIDDEAGFPWLAAEKQAIRAAIEAGKTVIGVCLGAQLIASALGASVRPGTYREIGWFDLQREEGAERSPLAGLLPERFSAFHWHGDTFDLPPDALLLASSEACRNQIFSVGERVLGFQCHLETTPETARALIEHCGEDLEEKDAELNTEEADTLRYVQTAEQILAQPERFADINQLASQIVKALDS